MKAIKGFVIALLCISLAGCGWLGLRDRSNDYLLSEEVEPIIIPDGIYFRGSDLPNVSLSNQNSGISPVTFRN